MTAQLPALGQNRALQNPDGNSMMRASFNLGMPQSRLEDDVQSYQSVHEELNQIEDVIDQLSQRHGHSGQSGADDNSDNQSVRSAQVLQFGKKAKRGKPTLSGLGHALG